MENIKKFKSKFSVLAETEKAIKVPLIISKEINGVIVGYYETYQWIPKSVIDEDGVIKKWFWEKVYEKREYYYKGGSSYIYLVIPDADGKFYIEGEVYQFRNKLGYHKITSII